MTKLTRLDWLKEHVAHDGDGCLFWPFGKDDKGYGILSVGSGVVRKAHRIMCKMVNGEPPDESYHAAHECGNGHLGCVHPKHLVWKTPEQNQADTVKHGTCRQRGRSFRKLTDADVAAIRSARGQRSRSDLSRQYDVRTETIDRIWSGRTRNRPPRYSRPYPADVRASLGKMGAEMRAAGMAYDAIALRLGVSRGTAKTMIREAAHA